MAESEPDLQTMLNSASSFATNKSEVLVLGKRIDKS